MAVRKGKVIISPFLPDKSYRKEPHMGELTYILKRILQMIPVLLIITLIIFFGMRLIPGDPAILLVGNRASDEAIAAMRTKLGLDQPLYVQYFLFLKQCLTFDFGNSLSLKSPVVDLFKQKAVITVSLTLMTALISIIISFPLGYISGIKHNSKIGSIIDSCSLAFISVPEFLIGLILLLIFAMKLHAFPVGGWGNTFPEHIRSLILPAFTGALATSALVLRNIRGNVIEVLKTDYVDFAYSKGLSPQRIRNRYIIRNVMVSTVTLLAMRMTYMLAGSIVIENVFVLPGLGQLLLNAILSRDYTVVQGTVFLFSIIVLIMNLITDISYSLLDPRVKLD